MRHCFGCISGPASGGYSGGCSGLGELPGVVEAAVPGAGGGEVDLDQRHRGAGARLGQQNRREGVAPQVRVALLHQPGGERGHLRPDNGDLQRHVRRRGESPPNVAPFPLGFDDAFVGVGVGLGERCRPFSKLFGAFQQPGGVGQLPGREAGGHAREGGGQRNGHRRGGAPAGSRFTRDREVQKPVQRKVEVAIVGGNFAQNNPTTSPFSSMSILSAAGWALRPGIVRMSPHIG